MNLNVLSEGKVFSKYHNLSLSEFLSNVWTEKDIAGKGRLYYDCNELKKYGICFEKISNEGYKATLSPLPRDKLPDKLKHYGILKAEFHALVRETSDAPEPITIDNIFALKEHKVFGNQNKNRPTYLKGLDTHVVPGSLVSELIWECALQAVSLIVNTDILCKMREIYADPEGTYKHQAFKREFGNSFFVLGGIPSNSIICANIISKSGIYGEDKIFEEVSVDELLKKKESVQPYIFKVSPFFKTYRILFDKE